MVALSFVGPVCMAALVQVSEPLPKYLSWALDCIGDHMVVLCLMTMEIPEDQVWDHLMVDQNTESRDQKIDQPILVILDTLVSAQGVQHMDQDSQALVMALAVAQEALLRELLHWEAHLAWTWEAHLDTCYHLSLAEALALQGFLHPCIPDTDHMVGWLEDKWTMVVEFLMTLLVDLLGDIRVLEDIHSHPILCCTYHCQSLVDQNFGHTGPAKMVVEVPHVPGNYCKQGRLVDHHILLHVQVGVVLVGRKGDILVRVDHPFLDGVVEPVWDLRLEGSCCSWEGSQCNHLENCQ